MENRIEKALSKKKKLISIYFTAGFPKLEDTKSIILALEKSSVDMIEIGLPYSDPLADGPVIQQSSTQALKNGMSTRKLFTQLKNIRETVEIPLIIMGYFNAMLQFGVEEFCIEAEEIGIDGIIMPDLPIDIFQKNYQAIFENHNLKFIPLITPETSSERIQTIDELDSGFIYMVSTSKTTGSETGFNRDTLDYFERIGKMKLQNDLMVGFGIKDNSTFNKASKHTKGCIIGSAFIKHLSAEGIDSIGDFIQKLK
ncbi:tryptophan synthase subunit alpha [Psychroflexus aestuariivivens]|uniref:tryptophan synthase subunit alpha n=1 Tax=Psychroflexus aestuariivivens TaxID=1795040 RepID=UPI000FDA2970|nr:tryptophan synthase subunit alpha [Psychroflexus aestuariivivens]